MIAKANKELLVLDDLTAGYGQSHVLHNLSLSLRKGFSVALLGRNGAGKTTLINTIMGLTTLHTGNIYLKNKNISNMPTHKRSNMGLGWVPQERGIFPSLTVEENLATTARNGSWHIDSIFDLFPVLYKRLRNYGNQLSGGEQQMLAIGRALMTNPSILLLDEPLEGLAPKVANDVLRSINTLLVDQQISVMIVEQQPKQILPITKQAIILDKGQIVYNGKSKDLLKDNYTQNKWLGATSTTSFV